MPTENPIYSHRDDDPHLTGDALAEKVTRYLRYATLIDTSNISIIAVGNMVILFGSVPREADIACAGEAAASVIGVAKVENQLMVRGQAVES